MGLAGTLVLTRFLAPAEFGDVSAAAIVIDTATRFTNYNLGTYVVTRQAGPDVTFQAFVYHVGAMAAACLAVTVFRTPIASALGSPGIAAYLPWLALATLILQISRIPEATIYRGLRFRALALTRAAGEVAYTVTSVLLAPLLRGGAVVAGNLTRSATVTVGILVRADRAEWLHPVALRLSTAREMFRFGFPLSTRTLADKLAMSWDNLLVARFFGNHVMGQYALAYNLADITGQIAEYITDVLLPSLSKLDAAKQKLALPRISAMMGLVIFPLIAGLAVVSPLVVAALLAPRWAGAAPMLVILCFRSLPVPLMAVFASYFAVRGHTKAIMYLGLARLALVLVFLMTFGQWGPLWACTAVVLAFLLSAALHLIVGWHLEQLSPEPLIAATLRPLLASALMAAAVLAFRMTVGAWIPLPLTLELVLEVCVGMLAYAAAAFLVARPVAEEFVGVARNVMARKAVR